MVQATTKASVQDGKRAQEKAKGREGRRERKSERERERSRLALQELHVLGS